MNKSTTTHTSLKLVIQTPNGQAFQERYVVLGRQQGKTLLRQDCRTLKIAIPMRGLEVIEKGFSRKARINYNNDGSRWDYDMGSGGIGTNCSQSTGVNPALEKKREEEAAEKALLDRKKLYEKAILDRKKKREQKKQRLWEKAKNKMADLDSWEDI